MAQFSVFLRLSIGEKSVVYYGKIYISHYKVTSLFHKDTRDCRCWNLEQRENAGGTHYKVPEELNIKYWWNSTGQSAPEQEEFNI